MNASRAADVGRASPCGIRINCCRLLSTESGNVEMQNISIHNWTDVTTNPAVLDHLFQLYFSWVHPVHTLFNEGHFVDSYKRQLNSYCSGVLVNAICAMACHLHTISDSDNVDYKQLGHIFSDTVGLNMDETSKNLTTIQAMAVMFLVYCARGNSLRASIYLRMAVQSLRKLPCIDSDEFKEVVWDTQRGVWCLDMYAHRACGDPN